MSFLSLLNKTATFYTLTASAAAITGQQIFTETKIAEGVKCTFQHSGGGLDRNSRLAKEDKFYRLYMLPPTFAVSKMGTIVEIDGEKYRVREIIDMGGRGRYTRLDLERYGVND